MVESKRFSGAPWLCAGAVGLSLVVACGGTIRTGAGDGGAAGGTTVGGASGNPGVAGSVSQGGSVGTGGRAVRPPPFGGSTSAGGFPSSCPPQFGQCGSVCTDLLNSPASCGSCFNACPPDAKCVNGTCQFGGSGTVCAPGETYCRNFGRCLDLQSNVFACGSCDFGCGNGWACINGKCDPSVCLVGVRCVDGDGVTRCPDVNTDSANCGACGHRCGSSETCQQGVCLSPQCFGSDKYCQSSGCTDLGIDVRNCGGCDKSCTGGGTFDYEAYACTKGTCGCSPTANPCGTACASAFWYCPSSGDAGVGSPQALCAATARNRYEACACRGCLAEIEKCAGSASCVNAMDCSLHTICTACDAPFSSCGDEQGRTDPLAEKLTACMNSRCAKP